MKRVLVLGCPGSGKSTFSRKLNSKTNLPICYLDNLLWNPDQTTVSNQIFKQRLAHELEKPAWIMDGNYLMTLPQRLAVCDTIFLLDYPTELCVESVRQRVGKKRADLPWIEEKADPRFLSYIRTFRAQQLPKMMFLLQKYPTKKLIIFKTREQADEYLAKL